jgi:hypothetical protein
MKMRVPVGVESVRVESLQEQNLVIGATGTVRDVIEPIAAGRDPDERAAAGPHRVQPSAIDVRISVSACTFCIR